MTNLYKTKAAGGNQAAFVRTLPRSVNYNRSYKRKPGYYAEFCKLPPTADPIFVAVDWNASNFVRRFKGVSLICDDNPECYDLSFCHMREVWVLFSESDNFAKAVQLARIVQSMGAKKIYTILVDIQLMGVNHD